MNTKRFMKMRNASQRLAGAIYASANKNVFEFNDPIEFKDVCLTFAKTILGEEEFSVHMTYAALHGKYRIEPLCGMDDEA